MLGKPREREGIVKVTKDTRKDALETANDFLNQGIPFVTIIAEGIRHDHHKRREIVTPRGPKDGKRPADVIGDEPAPRPELLDLEKTRYRTLTRARRLRSCSGG